MLRINAGVSRKLTKDFNSMGFSLNIDAEILTSLDERDEVIEKIREVFNLAEEALAQQVERHQAEEAAPRTASLNPSTADRQPNGEPTATAQRSQKPGNGQSNAPAPRPEEPASNKQVQYLLSLAKRHRLAGPKLDARLEEIVGRSCGPHDLTKKEAGAVIDALGEERVEIPQQARRN